MTFIPSTYVNFVSAGTGAQHRLFLRYVGPRDDFDIVVVGSGIGGGLLADDLAERYGGHKRILVLEAGSFIYSTHVYNVCRFPNASLARHFGCDTFWQAGHVDGGRVDGVAVVNDEAVRFIAGHDRPELLNRPLGGRVFGHIPVHESPGADIEHHEDV